MKRGALLAVLVASISFSAVAQTTFTFTSFDPPDSSSTQAWGINTTGAVVGSYSAPGGVAYGFERRSTGSFMQPFKISGENVYVDGINANGVLSGYYSASPVEGYPPSSSITSFTLAKGVYTDFTAGTQTAVYGINNKGDLAGIYQASKTSYSGFLHIAATNTTVDFSVTGAELTFAYGLNNAEIVVGAYKETLSGTTYQGFERKTDGDIVTFGFPGAISSIAYGINECDEIVGSFATSAGTTHGFYGKLKKFTQIDYPGSTSTLLSGISLHGILVGQYVDASGVTHGFIATPPKPTCTP